MQIDMHFYGIYALARAAGLKAQIAQIIAHSSQFVDDAIDAEAVALSDGRALLPLMTSHRPIDYQNTLPADQWTVWIPFHFLPGGITQASTTANSKHVFISKLVCRQDSQTARKMLRNSLAKKNRELWPHLIGITAHVYADTFSHSGFVGLAHNWNKVQADSIEIISDHNSSILHYVWAKFEEFKTRFVSDFAEIIPVGHAAVATFPDRPYLRWKFIYERSDGTGHEVIRDNPSIYMEACKQIYQYFSKFSDVSPNYISDNGPRAWEKIQPALQDLICYEAPKEERIARWKETIARGRFNKLDSLDKSIDYRGGLWRARGAEYQVGEPGKIQSSNAYCFFRAAREHLRYVLGDLFPKVGILA